MFRRYVPTTSAARNLLSGLLLLALLSQAGLAEPAQARISGGSYLPLYQVGKVSTRVQVDDFLIDRYPVTNADFLDFVSRRFCRTRFAECFLPRSPKTP